jgi:hypothetical protein
VKSYRILLGTVLLLLVGYIIAKLNEPKEVDWSVSLSKSDKNPYGSYILYDQLKNLYPDALIHSFREPVYNRLHKNDYTTSAYFLVSPELKIGKLDKEELLKFAEAGNYVFISAYSISKELLDTLGLKMEHGFSLLQGDSTSVRSLGEDSLRKYYIDKFPVNEYFSKVNIKDSSMVLGYADNKRPNFVRVAVGDGAFYLHAAPLCFSNYFLLHNNNDSYTSKVLSHLPATVTNIYWDEYYKLGRGGAQTPLRFFLNNTYLSWALWLSVIGLILFVLFNMKRKQRIIPVITPLQNTTLDFVKTVASVYFNQKDNASVCRKKIKYWLEFVRQHFYLSTQQLDEEFIHSLVKKSGAEEKLIRQIVNYILIPEGNKISDSLLLEISSTIDTFYKQAK